MTAKLNLWLMPAGIALLAAFIGLIIVKLVDSRLKDISINMPTVNLPPININMGAAEGPQVTLGSFGSAVPAAPVLKQSGGAVTVNEPVGKVKVTGRDEEANEQMKITPTVDLPAFDTLPQGCRDRTRYIVSRYGSETVPLIYKGITPVPSYAHNESPAPYPRNPSALTTKPDPRSDLTSQYYLNPQAMTPAQLDKFKFKSGLDKMTVIDYTNWLLLFNTEPEKLSGFHRANLRVLLRGGKLTYEDLPRVSPLPPKSDHEYTAKLAAGTLDNVPQPDTLGFLPFNYDVNVGSEPNRSMRHLDFINPDEPMKTWVLTSESKQMNVI
jgi:hypothetical protein